MTSVNHLNPSGSTISDEYHTENCFLSCDLFKQPQTIWSLRCRHVWLCFMWRLHSCTLIQMCSELMLEAAVWMSEWCSYPQVLRHVEQLLSQAAEGGQQQTHALICSETSLRQRTGRPISTRVTDRQRSAPDDTSLNKPCLLHVNLFSVQYQYIATYCNVYNTI